MKKKLLLLPALICTLLFVLSGCGSGQDATATSMKLRKAEGEVQVNDAKDKSIEVMENLALYSGYNVGTKAASYSWVDLDNVKLVKLDESSQMGVEKDGSNLKLQLKSGNLFFHITEPLGNDESMEIRTSTLALGVRGTCGWVETSEDGEARVALLEGKVECTAGDKSAFVSAGEMAYLDESGEIIVEQLDASAIPAFVTVEIEQDETLMKAVQEFSVGGADGAASSEEAGAEESEASEANATAQADNSAEENPIKVPGENGWTSYYYRTVTQTVGDADTPRPPEQISGMMEWDLNQFWNPSYNVVMLGGKSGYVAEAKDAYGITYREYEQGRNEQAMKWIASFIEKRPDSLLASLAKQCSDQLVIVSQGGEGSTLGIAAANGNKREAIIDYTQWTEYDGSGGTWFVVDSEPEDCLYFAISSWIFTDIEGGSEGSEQMCHRYLEKLDKAGLPPIEFSR